MVRLSVQSIDSLPPRFTRLAAPQKGNLLSADHKRTMSADLAEARKTPLFDSPSLTRLLWSPRSRTEFDKIVAILQKEPLFRKTDKSDPKRHAF